MRYAVAVILLMFSTLFGADIVWQKNLKTALESAGKTHKLVMVMVEGKHCRWCKKMRYRTLSDSRVVEALQKGYVSVRVDEEDSATMAELPAVNGVPTIFFMTPDKTLLDTSIGYYGVEDFLSFFPEVERARKALKHRS